jgi:hypothetical protein
MINVFSDIYLLNMIRDLFTFWVIVSFVHSDDKEKKIEHDRKNCSSVELSIRHVYYIHTKKTDKDLSSFIIIG